MELIESIDVLTFQQIPRICLKLFQLRGNFVHLGQKRFDLPVQNVRLHLLDGFGQHGLLPWKFSGSHVGRFQLLARILFVAPIGQFLYIDFSFTLAQRHLCLLLNDHPFVDHQNVQGHLEEADIQPPEKVDNEAGDESVGYVLFLAIFGF